MDPLGGLPHTDKPCSGHADTTCLQVSRVFYKNSKRMGTGSNVYSDWR